METIPRNALGVKEISFQAAFSQSQETLDESLFFMQRMVFFATSQILQLRELISQKAFQKRAFDDTVFYALDPDHPVGFELVQELEGPLKEIGQGSLKKLMIVVRDLQADIDGDDCEESIVVHEVFSMQLTYGVNGSIVISRERDEHIMCEMIYSGPESVKRETANLIEQIAKLKQILAPLPSFVGFCFRIILNNDQSSFLNFRVVTRPLSLPVEASYKCVGGVVTGQAGMLLDVQSVYLRKEAMSRVHTPLRLGIQPTHHFTRSPSRTRGTATTMVEPRTMLIFGEDSEQMGAFDEGMGQHRHHDGASSGFSVPSHPSPLSHRSGLSHLSASSPHSNRTVGVVASGMDLHSQRQSTGSGFSSVESKKSTDKSNVLNTEEKKSERRSTSTTTTTSSKKVDASSSVRPIASKRVVQPESSTKPDAKPASVKATITFERPDPGHQQAKKVDKFAKLLGERLNKLRVEKPREEVHEEERRLSIRGTHPTLLKFPTGTGPRLPVFPLSSPRTLSRQPVSPLSSPRTLSSEDKYSSSASSGTNMYDVTETGNGHQDGDTLQDIPSIDREEETEGVNQDEAREREKSNADGGRQPTGDRSSLVVHAPSVRLRRQPRGMKVGEDLAQPRIRVPMRGKAVIDVDPNYKESKVNALPTVPSVRKHSSNESRISRKSRRDMMVDAEKERRESVEKEESEQKRRAYEVPVFSPVSSQRSPSQIRYSFSPLSTVSSPPIPPSETVTRAATSRSATFLETSVTTRKVADTSLIEKNARKSMRRNVVEPFGEDNEETGDKTTSSDDTMMDVDSISMAVDSSAMEPSIEAPRDDSGGKKQRNDGTDMRTSLEVHADTVRKRKMAKPMKPEQEIAQPRRRVPMRGRAVIDCDDGESERKKEREEKEVIPSAVRNLTPPPPPTTIHRHWARTSPIGKQVIPKGTVVSGEPKRRRMARTGRIDQ